MTEKSNPNNESRRKFVRNSALVVGGGVLASALPVGASAYVKGDDTIKVAVIGCGGRGTGAAGQALSAEGNIQLVAMADAFRDRLDTSFENLTKPNQTNMNQILRMVSLAFLDAP